MDERTSAGSPRTSPCRQGVALVDARGGDNGLRFVDLNGDGFDDIFQSNDAGYAIHLWAGKVSADLGWKRGWSHSWPGAARRAAEGAARS